MKKTSYKEPQNILDIFNSSVMHYCNLHSYKVKSIEIVAKVDNITVKIKGEGTTLKESVEKLAAIPLDAEVYGNVYLNTPERFTLASGYDYRLKKNVPYFYTQG